MKLLKTEYAHNTATFVLLEPNNVDRNGDVITEDEIVKSAHEFGKNLVNKVVNLNHEDETDFTKDEAHFVENYVTPCDVEVGGVKIAKGSWLVGIKFNDDIFKKLVEGEYSGVSMEGTGIIE